MLKALHRYNGGLFVTLVTFLTIQRDEVTVREK